MDSLESPHRGDSNEYTQHTLSFQTIDKTSLSYPYLSPDRALFNPRRLIYPCLEQISTVTKLFEP